MRTRLIACYLAVVFSITAFAQADRGTMTGTVIDPAGAVVANATIQIRNLGTASLYPSATSETGNYTVGQLPPGTYELQVIAPGFKQYNRRPANRAGCANDPYRRDARSRLRGGIDHRHRSGFTTEDRVRRTQPQRHREHHEHAADLRRRHHGCRFQRHPQSERRACV